MPTSDAVIDEWLRTPFPAGSSTNDDLDEVHAEIALVDTWVAECVLEYRHAGIWSPAVPDVFAELDRVSEELDEIPLNDVEQHAQALQYASYLHLLRDAYRAFLELGRQS